MSKLKLTLIISITILLVSIALILVFKTVYKQKEVPVVGCGTWDRHMSQDLKNTVNSKGKALFMTNCSSCHQIAKKCGDRLLKNIQDRVPSREWVYGFVRNADSVIKSGDAYANALFKEYGESHQPSFPNLSKDDIDAILNYCDVSWKPQTVH